MSSPCELPTASVATLAIFMRVANFVQSPSYACLILAAPTASVPSFNAEKAMLLDPARP
jgi:hypothetical protein